MRVKASVFLFMSFVIGETFQNGCLVKIKFSLGSNVFKLLLIVLEDYGFFIHILEDALFIVI